MVKEKKPLLVFIMEAKMHNKKLSYLSNKTGIEHMFMVDSRGKSGGLILLWKHLAIVEIQNFCIRHINAVACLKHEGVAWKFTGFCGHSKIARREEV